jgi:hypothetical protein
MRGQTPRVSSDSSLMSRLSQAALLAFLVLLLFACPSPISTDQINPVPTDLVLSVTDTVPPNGATGFNPGQRIVVSFNRDLDPACLQESTSPVSVTQTSGPSDGPPITLTITPDTSLRKIFIEPHPFLASDATYSVKFETTLKDASGNALPKQVEF